VARWEPNARDRLQLAALELFEERGFEQTTVEDIATRAGLTKRTFFRHFADKREVLFGGGEEFQQLVVSALDDAPDPVVALDAVALGLRAAGAALQGRRAFAHRRHRVIAASPELQERELVKLATIAGALARALRERGVPEPDASLAAEAGIAVLRVAFERWAAGGEDAELPQLIDEALAGLRAVAAPLA
jgi:AcrR family transcriptional regulator